MAYETFAYPFQAEPSGAITYRLLSVQFGDGYEQVAEDGINIEKQSWPLTFIGTAAEMLPILQFLRRHRGYIRFLWTPPGFEQALFKARQFNYIPNSGGNASITATFELAPAP